MWVGAVLAVCGAGVALLARAADLRDRRVRASDGLPEPEAGDLVASGR
jgi:hypothetical protein